jgi:hypothetical protein
LLWAIFFDGMRARDCGNLWLSGVAAVRLSKNVVNCK